MSSTQVILSDFLYPVASTTIITQHSSLTHQVLSGSPNHLIYRPWSPGWHDYLQSQECCEFFGVFFVSSSTHTHTWWLSLHHHYTYLIILTHTWSRWFQSCLALLICCYRCFAVTWGKAGSSCWLTGGSEEGGATWPEIDGWHCITSYVYIYCCTKLPTWTTDSIA